MLRLLRIFRILKLTRYSKSFKTLIEAFRRAGPELVSVAFVVFIVIVISAIALYYAEHDSQPDVYRSIPETFWWAVVTLTTVGYGDVYPVTPLGRIIASIIMLAGIGIIAIPAGILSSTMTEILGERRGKNRNREEEGTNRLLQ